MRTQGDMVPLQESSTGRLSSDIIFPVARIDEIAARLVGVPFKRFGRDLSGLDCWGLVIEFYQNFGIVVDDPLKSVGINWIDTDTSMKVNGNLFVRTKHRYFGGLVTVQISAAVEHAMVILNDSFFLNIDSVVGVYKMRIERALPDILKTYKARGLRFQ